MRTDQLIRRLLPVIATWALVFTARAEVSPPTTTTEPFITIWELTGPTTIIFPMRGSTNINIDWGDGSPVEVFSGSNPTHAFASAGTFSIEVSCNALFPEEFGSFSLGNLGTRLMLVEMAQWGTGVWSNLDAAFQGANNCVFSATDHPLISPEATTASAMFQSCFALTDPDFSNWDMQGITDLSRMFYDAHNFNGDITAWNVSSVTNMGETFFKAYAFNQDLGNWDVSSVTNFAGMFFETSSFNADLSNWSTESATNMISMFTGATVFNSNLNGWDVSGVTHLTNCFANCLSFNSPLDAWDVGQVIAFDHLFSNAAVFNQPLDSWDVSSATSFQNMFLACTLFNQNLNSWDVSGVTNFQGMFHRAQAFNGDVSSWNVGSGVNFSEMFRWAAAFAGDLSNWDMTQAQTTRLMFNEAYLFNSDLSNWNTSNVTNMGYMFGGASSFNQPLSGWDVSQVTDMTNLFVSASSFDQDLSDWAWAPSVNTPNLLLNVALSPHNYDALLLSLADAHPAGMQLVSNSKCSDFPEVLAARTQLQAELPTFSDGGVVAGNLDQTAITPTGGTTLTTAGTVDRYGTRNTDAALTIYGDEVSPSDWTAPLVVTRAPDASAWPIGLSGVLGSHGGQSLTALGFCLNTTGNPTTANDTLEVTPVLGAFTADLSGLLPSTTYHVRAFATNALGTDYGQSFEFTTPAFACGHSSVEFDGHAYLTTQIGSQCWFAENLQTTIFADVDATPIPTSASWSTTTTPARTHYNEGGPSDEVTVAQHGRLYNFYAVADPKGICPSGWHVPSNAEWVTLQSTIEAVPLNIAQALMNRPTDDPSWMGTNDVGFNGAPSGWREPNGSFVYQNSHAAWWTSTPGGGGAVDRVLIPGGLFGYSPSAQYGLSVRCIQN